mmetsp:Transcript_62806/g.185481  ORF Transcript_62806/g.185481 Transcript_62806/m.185481 type:complete len:186 (-) Transcript_62806:588-1145(-)
MVNNPLGAFFRRGSVADGSQRSADFSTGTGAIDLSDGSLPDLRGFWNKIHGSSGSRGVGESSEHLTKDQEGNLKSLLRRYSLDNDVNDGPENDCDEENGGNNHASSKDMNGKASSSDNEEGEGCCSCCCALTYWERLLGCLVFFAGGYVLEIGSLKRFAWLIRGHPCEYAIYAKCSYRSFIFAVS